MAKRGVPGFAEVVAADVEPPEELAYLLVWYDEIRRQNSRGMHFEPISFTEMKAYRDLMDLEMTPFDVDLLCHLDNLWCAHVPKAASGSSPG